MVNQKAVTILWQVEGEDPTPMLSLSEDVMASLEAFRLSVQVPISGFVTDPLSGIKKFQQSQQPRWASVKEMLIHQNQEAFLDPVLQKHPTAAMAAVEEEMAGIKAKAAKVRMKALGIEK